MEAAEVSGKGYAKDKEVYYLTIIPRVRDGYEMVDSQRVGYNLLISNKFWAYAYTYHNIIWRAWYNCSYTMMAKPIRALELHYPMIQFLIITNTHLLFCFGCTQCSTGRRWSKDTYQQTDATYYTTIGWSPIPHIMSTFTVEIKKKKEKWISVKRVKIPGPEYTYLLIPLFFWFFFLLFLLLQNCL